MGRRLGAQRRAALLSVGGRRSDDTGAIVIPGPSTWETQCFVSAAITGTCAVVVITAGISRRLGGTSRVRQLLIASTVALIFLIALTLVFMAAEPCAQGPA
jgi:hypothetical protein